MSKGAIKVTRDGGVTWEIIDTIKGDQGYSAYEVWEQMPGNAGKTEQDFAEYIVGEQGLKGDPFVYEDFTPEQLALLVGDPTDSMTEENQIWEVE